MRTEKQGGSMHTTTYSRVWCAVLGGLLLGGVLAGCNVFGGIGEDSDDPQVLLRDARAALDRGDPQTAVGYLEQAFEMDPNDPEIRIELAGARFAVAEIDLLTLKGLVEHINGGASSQARASGAGKAGGAHCTFDADPETLESFDYTAAPEYQRIRAEIEMFVDARDLLDGIRPADLAALPEETRARWYLVRAFTRIALAIDAIHDEGERIDAALYRLPAEQNSIGICAASASALEAAEARIKCDHLSQILQGLDELEQRSLLLDDADISGIIDELRQAVDVVGAQLGSNVIRFCSTRAGR